jgi:predicted DNA-binding transcriptional regulator AlpA
MGKRTYLRVSLGSVTRDKQQRRHASLGSIWAGLALTVPTMSLQMTNQLDFETHRGFDFWRTLATKSHEPARHSAWRVFHFAGGKMDLSGFLTRSDVATLAGITMKTVDRLTSRGVCPAPLRLGRSTLFREDEVRHWLRTYRRHRRYGRDAAE